MMVLLIISIKVHLQQGISVIAMEFRRESEAGFPSVVVHLYQGMAALALAMEVQKWGSKLGSLSVMVYL